MLTGKGLRYVKRTRSRGKVYAYFDTGQKDAKGKRIYAPLGLLNARDFGARYAAMLGHRSRRDTIVAEMTVTKLHDLYQRGDHYRKKSVNTRKVYDLYMGEFARQLATAPAGQIERRDVIAIVDKMGDRPAAANLMLSSIRVLYSWARKRGHVDNDPCRDIDPLEIGEHSPWPEWLVEEGLKASDDRVRLGINLLYYTAQRISDVCNMRWTDIGPSGIEGRQQKTGTPFVIPIHEKLREVLDKTPRSGLTILTRHDGRKLSEDSLRTAIKEWLADKVEETFVPHGLRKNAVNALLECECSVAEVAAISRQSLTMIEHYAKGRNVTKLASAAILKWERKA